LDKSRAIIPKHFQQCGSFSNIVTKFDDDPLKNIQVREQTRLILANSRAITPMSFKGSDWLSNLAEIFCHQTFSQSLMMIH